MSNGALWGEQISHQLTTARANRQIAKANRELEKAETLHLGTVARCVAYMAALRRLDPGNALLVPAVSQVIDAQGEACAAYQDSFGNAWALKFAPEEILADLKKKQRNAVDVLTREIENEPILEKKIGLLWWKSTVFTWCGIQFQSHEGAAEGKTFAVNELKSKMNALELDDFLISSTAQYDISPIKTTIINSLKARGIFL
jgi:hypothetical protein